MIQCGVSGPTHVTSTRAIMYYGIQRMHRHTPWTRRRATHMMSPSPSRKLSSPTSVDRPCRGKPWCNSTGRAAPRQNDGCRGNDDQLRYTFDGRFVSRDTYTSMVQIHVHGHNNIRKIILVCTRIYHCTYKHVNLYKYIHKYICIYIYIYIYAR